MRVRRALVVEETMGLPAVLQRCRRGQQKLTKSDAYER
jgi:hypothetical protein